MEMLDRYLGYEAWTLRYCIEHCRRLSRAQMHQHFDIGQGSLHATLSHIIGNIEVWTDLMREHPVRQLPPLPETIDGYLQRFDAAMADFSICARELLAEGLSDATYMDVLETPPQPKTFGGTILHVLTHTTVHRWEIQHMLQRLSADDLIEGDVLDWERRRLRQAV
jgi:uncharacterized damage-inducible protein DinB